MFAVLGNYLLCGYVKGDFFMFVTVELRGTVVLDLVTVMLLFLVIMILVVKFFVIVYLLLIICKCYVFMCQLGIWFNVLIGFSYCWLVKGCSCVIVIMCKLIVWCLLVGCCVLCCVIVCNVVGAAIVLMKVICAK